MMQTPCQHWDRYVSKISTVCADRTRCIEYVSKCI